MTRDDMEIIVEYYLSISGKAVLESTDIQASPREVEEFMEGVLGYVECGIGVGAFDE